MASGLGQKFRTTTTAARRPWRPPRICLRQPAKAASRASTLLPRIALVTAIGALLAGGAGCGAGEGVAAGAAVAVYVEAPLCAGAKRELASEGGRAGSVRVRAVCLAATADGNRENLATIGANARRAAEDSAVVAYVGEFESPAARFSRPILEAAGIAQVTGPSGRAAMASVLRAVRGASGSDDLRGDVDAALDG